MICVLVGTGATKPGVVIARSPYGAVLARASAAIRRRVAAASRECGDCRSSI